MLACPSCSAPGKSLTLRLYSQIQSTIASLHHTRVRCWTIKPTSSWTVKLKSTDLFPNHLLSDIAAVVTKNCIKPSLSSEGFLRLTMYALTIEEIPWISKPVSEDRQGMLLPGLILFCILY